MASHKRKHMAPDGDAADSDVSTSDSSGLTDENDETYVPSDDEGSIDIEHPRIRPTEIRLDDPPPSTSAVTDVEENDHVTDNGTSNDELPQGKKKQPKRKYAEPSQWGKNIRKVKRNSGCEYTSSKGKTVAGKPFIDYVCNCRRKCHTLLSTENKKACYDRYYARGSWDAQTAFLCGSVKIVAVKQRVGSNGDASKRQESRLYYLKGDQVDVQVCKSLFLNTLRIDSARVHRALSKGKSGNLADNRGRHAPGNKLSDTAEERVKEHIKSFPRYASHYTREKSPDCKYLQPGLNLCLMYRLYNDICKTDNVTPVSQSSYERVFRRCFNLKFKAPQKDTCKTCDSLNIQLKAEEGKPLSMQNKDKINRFKTELALHHSRVEAAKTAKKADETLAKTGEIAMLTFDLQKTLPIPKLSTGVAYYKRQLSVYNLGVHDCKNNKATMHVWHEGLASRGPNEIASCLLKYITSNNITTNHLVLWSDSCGGQNRNIKMTAAIMHIVQREDIPISIIEHKFPVPGHSFLPNDSDFGDVEKRLRYHTNVYTIDDYCSIISECRPRKQAFEVSKMIPEDFTSTKPVQSLLTNRKTTISDDQVMKVQWLNMRFMRVEKSKPGILMFKYTHNNEVEFFEVNLNKRIRGKPSNLANVILPQLYPTGHQISQAKKNDILALLDYVPPIHHVFFQTLPTQQNSGNASDEDIDGIEPSSDNENGFEEDS